MSFTYKGLKAHLKKHIVTDQEVDRQIERLQQDFPRIEEADDRPTQSGDEIVLDYAGFCEGVRFEGGTAENQTLVLGSGMFIPGFEEQLLDKVPGEEVTVHVTFPKEYHAENLAGKDAEFHCVVRSIRVKQPYELDDVFAKEVGGCETFAEMQAKLKESLQAYADQRGEMDLQDRLLRQAAQSLDVEITDVRRKEAVDQQMQNMQAQLAQSGLTLEMYCQFMNTSEETLRKDVEAEALMNVRIRAAVEKITELEKLEVSEAEIAEACEVICRQNSITMDRLKEQYDAEFEQAVINSILTTKVMQLIREAADVAVV